jgi:trehalose/maltose hydrolase-like predicted phosphorylase
VSGTAHCLRGKPGRGRCGAGLRSGIGFFGHWPTDAIGNGPSTCAASGDEKPVNYEVLVNLPWSQPRFLLKYLELAFSIEKRAVICYEKILKLKNGLLANSVSWRMTRREQLLNN